MRHLPYKLVIVGGGRVGRVVMGSILGEVGITVVDIDPGVLADLPDGVTGIVGDGSSRLVLERAGVDRRTRVAIVTDDDAVNREVVRILEEDFEVHELICLLSRPDPEERASEHRYVSRDQAAGEMVLDLLTESDNRGGSGLGLGLGEIRQVTVLPGGGVVGVPLRELTTSQWSVAAIYRGGELIIPQGSSRLEPDDQVLLVGPPEKMEAIASLVRGGDPVFPSQYGERIAFHPDVEAEARWWAEISHAREALPGVGGLLRGSREEIARRVTRESVGLVVVRPIPVRVLARLGLARSPLKDQLLAARVPVLVARGRQPYKRVLLAMDEQVDPRPTAIAAVDVARQAGAELTILSVIPPTLAGEVDADHELATLPERLAELSHVHGLDATPVLDRGNPIARIRAHAESADLLVIGTSDRRNTLIDPDISLYLLHDAPCSVLLVPRPGSAS